MRITNAQARAAYSIAKRVHGGELTVQGAVTQLERTHGMNPGSARDFVTDFRCMMRGQVFHRTMNAYATEYFLNGIRTDFGSDALRLAIDAVRSHLTYYEGLGNTKLRSIRRIVEKYAEALAKDRSLAAYQADFDRRVTESLASSPESRKSRLRKTPKKPEKLVVTTEVYARNADVVAEVLARAKGLCERCRRRAPFVRAKNDELYLEVHHKVQLAHGGDDTVENAIALCPNCHRELHYGKADT